MTSLTTYSLLVLCGICLYAALNHFNVALRKPCNKIHLIFACLCLAVSLSAFGLIQTYQAQTIPAFVGALRWNLAFILILLMLFHWFIAGFSGVRPRLFLPGMTALFALLFLVNLFVPYTVQYTDIDYLQFLRLPWGEVISVAHGHNSLFFTLGILAVIVEFGFALYALTKAWRQQRRHTTLAMLVAIGIFILTSLEGIAVRVAAIDFIHLGMYGYLVMIIVMSVALSNDTQQRLRDSERRFRSLVEQSPFSIQVLSPDGKTRQVNPAWQTLWGVGLDAIKAYNILTDQQLVDKGIMPYITQGFAGTATEIPPIVYNPADNPTATGPERNRWVRAYIYPIKDESEAIRDVILMHEDVTERKRIEDAIRLIAAGVSSDTGDHFFKQLVQSLARLFEADYTFIGLLDEYEPQRINTFAVCAHGEIAPDLSYTLPGTPCANVMSQKTCAYPRDVQQLFPEDRLLADMQVEGYIGTPLFDTTGQAVGLMVVLSARPLEHTDAVREIMEIFAARAGAELQRLQAEKRIRRMAYYDYLTGLASRAHLHEHLSDVLREVRLASEGGALLLIDLDHFKTINDALSHDVGDEVLRAVARRLNEVVGERAFVARLGGDEFVVLMRTGSVDTQSAEKAAQKLARQVLDKLLSPLFVGDRAFTLGASIGVVLFPENGENELDIVRHADMALYRAKHLGRGNIQFYSPNLQENAATRLQLEDGLRRAIGNGELELYFQPLLDVTERIIGAEALLRWHHPELGDIPPMKFIPIAEETGLIHSIGRWVFDQACERFTAWRAQGLAFTGHLSVNVCPWQFTRPDFIEQIRRSLAKYRIDPGNLMLELTETALLFDLEETIEKLSALRALGLRVALDDFGTGYSSLAYLRDLPLDQIKIDKSFISELGNAGEYPLIESMIAIGKHMKLAVVAEGVETTVQRDKLIALGCERFQGFLFCHPLPESEFLAWLARHTDSA